MPTNEFLPFANIGGANVLTQINYDALAARPTGFAAGIARSAELNKVWRQSSVMAAALAQFAMDSTGEDVLDTGVVADIAAQILRAVQARSRIKLTADLNLYVATTGNDVTNTGLTVGSPFLTIQRAWTEIFAKYDLNGFSVVINVANGTYTNQVSIGGTPVGAGPNSRVTFRGNVTTPSNCIVSVTLAICFNVGMVSIPITIEGFRLIATGVSAPYVIQGVGLNVFLATVNINKLEFGACGSGHMVTSNGARIFTNALPYAIVGGAPYHVQGYAGGLIIAANSTITLTGTPAFSQAFALATQCGLVEYYGNTFTGSATGPRYLAFSNGSINVNGGGASYLPGNAAGSVSSGGQYN